MNKSDLIKQVSEESGTSVKDAAACVDATLKVIQAELKQGGKVSLIGFGTFSAKERNGREGRNPKTGEKITIPAKTVAQFKASKSLLD